MEIELLKYFQMIAKSGSISSVARSVHLSQSALSQQMQKLENLLSRKLLERSNMGVTLTPAGRIVSRYAEYILQTYDEMMREIERAGSDSLIIRIEASHSLADYALPCMILTANRHLPRYQFQLSNRPAQDIMTSVANGLCDIGFFYDISLGKPPPDIVVEAAAVNRIVPVVGYAAPVRGPVTSAELAGMSIITFSEKSDIYEILSKKIAQTELEQAILRAGMKVEGIESAKTLVTRGYGVAFLPYISVKEEIFKKQMKIIEVPGVDLDLQVVIAYRREHPGHIEDFLQWFRRQGSKTFC
ncbi:MAG: LysR family transcriptional regulator [Christensenellales bacterium]|jgi:molybdate transport repressor ModE-like protein